MAEVTLTELRRRSAEVLDRIEAGETLIVTRRGRPVAELVRAERSGGSVDADPSNA